MTSRVRGERIILRLAAALGAIVLGETAIAQEISWTLRTIGVPPDPVVDYILQIGAPVKVTVERAKSASLADQVQAHCGYSTDALLQRAAVLNEFSRDDPNVFTRSRPDGIQRLPPCLFASVMSPYIVQANDGYEVIARRQMGLAEHVSTLSRRLRLRFCEINARNFQSRNCGAGPVPGARGMVTSLRQGQTILIPARPTISTLALREGLSIDQAVAGLRRVLQDRAKAEATPNNLQPARVGEDLFEVLDDNVQATVSTPETLACGAAPTNYLPYPIEQVHALWSATLKTGHRIEQRKSIITVMDTGLAENSLLLPWVHRTGNSRVDSGNPDDDHPDFQALPNPAIKPGELYFQDHGTHVGGVALGGPEHMAMMQTPDSWPLRLRYYRALQKSPTANVFSMTADAFIKGLSSLGVLSDTIRAEQSVMIVNMSVESTARLTRERDPDPRILIVAAAGNAPPGMQPTELTYGIARFPARYGGPYSASVIVVGATDRTHTKPAPFSNYGATYVDLFAPGDCIESYSLTKDLPDGKKEHSRVRYSGTSQAAPLVAFAAALLNSLGVDSPAAIKKRLVATVDHNEAFYGKAASSGRLNLETALDLYADRVQVAGRTIRGIVTARENLRFCTIEGQKVERGLEGLRRFTQIQSAKEKYPDVIPNQLVFRVVDPESHFAICSRTRDPNDKITVLTFGPGEQSKSESIRVDDILDFVPAYYRDQQEARIRVLRATAP